MRFRLALTLMTLDDLELVRIFSEFRVISQIWEATTAKRMKIDMYCQRCIHYVDIAGHSSARGLQSQIRNTVSENGDFLALCVNISETVRDTSNVTIND